MIQITAAQLTFILSHDELQVNMNSTSIRK